VEERPFRAASKQPCVKVTFQKRALAAEGVSLDALRCVVPCRFVRAVSDCSVGMVMGDVMVPRSDSHQVSVSRSG
jgi:hypothetical protein